MEGEGLRAAQGLGRAPSQQDLTRQARTVTYSAGGVAYVEQLEKRRSQGGLCGYRVGKA